MVSVIRRFQLLAAPPRKSKSLDFTYTVWWWLASRNGMFRRSGIHPSLWHFVAIATLLCSPCLMLGQEKWEKLAPFPEPAEEISGAEAGGKIFVFAGLAPKWKPMGMVYEYDP